MYRHIDSIIWSKSVEAEVVCGEASYPLTHHTGVNSGVGEALLDEHARPNTPVLVTTIIIIPYEQQAKWTAGTHCMVYVLLLNSSPNRKLHHLYHTVQGIPLITTGNVTAVPLSKIAKW